MPEDFEGNPPQELNWQKYAGVVRRRNLLFVLALLVGWATVWGASLYMPSIYRSGTLILVEQPTVPQQYVVSNISGDLQDRLDSITQQILSRTRLLRIINTLNLYAADRQKQANPDDLVERMRRDIEIELVRAPGHEQLSSFNIYYSSWDPHVAQQVTSELTNLFISENLERRARQSENTTEFLASQVEEARRTLAEQEEKVREFKDKHLGELPGQLQSNLQILGGLQTQLRGEEDALERAKQQNVYLDSLLNQYRAAQRPDRTGVAAPVGLPALDQELDRLRAQLADLSSHYTDRHPDVRKLKEQIAQDEKMKQQIMADLKAKPAARQTVDPTSPGDEGEVRDAAPMAELRSQLKVNQIEIANRQRSIEGLKGEIAQYQVRLNQAPVMEQQLTDLNRGYDQSRANYDSLLAKKNESELATNLERRQQGEHFRILDPPSLPVKPYSPNRLKFSGIGVVVGLGLGFVLSLAAEFLNDRIYSEEEFKQLIPVDAIAEIPSLLSPKEEKQQRRRLWLQWTTAAVVMATIAAASALSYLRG
jgi:polysaccharide chain length determinant protein (PEP-CTERM system associated)